MGNQRREVRREIRLSHYRHDADSAERRRENVSCLGWHVTYLGASLPAAEIAGAARQNRARAVALSLVYPEDDPRLEGELTLLRELLPPEVALLTGGRAMPAYLDAIEKIGAVQMKDLSNLSSTLDDLRKPSKKVKR